MLTECQSVNIAEERSSYNISWEGINRRNAELIHKFLLNLFSFYLSLISNATSEKCG